MDKKRLALLIVLCIMGMAAFPQEKEDPTQPIAQLLRLNRNRLTFTQEDDIQSLHARAEQGDSSAQYALFYCYFRGEKVYKDGAVAVSCLMQSAENDYPMALYMLGKCYQYGALGLPVWEEKAKECLFRASVLGHEDAQEDLEELTEEYEKEAKRVRRAVYRQTVSVAPHEQYFKYREIKKELIRQ